MSNCFAPCRTSAGGIVQNFVLWGEAKRPAMVLLHGLTGHARMWDAFAGVMARDHQVIALDQRGHGDTEWPQPPAYATADFVEDLHALTTLRGVEHFTLIGLSMGAHNALAFAVRHPEMVERLVSVDVPPTVSLPRDRQVLAGSDPARAGFASIAEAFAAERPVYPLSSEDVVMHRVRHNLKQREDGRWVWKHSPDVALRWIPEDLGDAIRTIRCPTLIVRGEKSEVFDPESAARTTRAIPRARLVTVEGSGHSVPMDRPVDFERVVREFLVPLQSESDRLGWRRRDQGGT